jgi:hypothetical protein
MLPEVLGGWIEVAGRVVLQYFRHLHIFVLVESVGGGRCTCGCIRRSTNYDAMRRSTSTICTCDLFQLAAEVRC